MILLSLALVVATATTLAWGVFASSDPLIWVSLAAGLGAVASVAGSVVRHRRHLVPEAIPDAGQQRTGSTAVGAASAGVDPAPSPTPSRPAPPAPPAPAPPAAGPVFPPGTWPGVEPVDEPFGEPASQPGVEQVAVRDALRVAQLDDEVLVVDGQPRYHLAGCPTLGGTGAGVEAIPLAVSAARRGGFVPCAICTPDSTLLARSRERAQQKAQQRVQDRAIERPTDESQQL